MRGRGLVIDTSALAAIVFDEPERDALFQTIEAAEKVFVCTVTVLETKMVVHGR